MRNEQLTDKEALDRIARYLTGREWDADDIQVVADLVRSTGRKIADATPTLQDA